MNFDVVRKQAAILQRDEKAQIEGLKSVYAKAQIKVWTLTVQISKT